jgi:hypothetical protein
MQDMKLENGLCELGYNKDDIPSMITGTLAQVNLFEFFNVLLVLYSWPTLYINSATFVTVTFILSASYYKIGSQGTI